jgi:hypothetical protein
MVHAMIMEMNRMEHPVDGIHHIAAPTARPSTRDWIHSGKHLPWFGRLTTGRL